LKFKKKDKNVARNEIPNIVIIDPYEYVTSNTIIANLIIISKHSEKKKPLIRTKKGGHVIH
jgi:hypothetical protein